MPAVSVILPAHNRAALLPEAIRSVLSQTFRDLELIVVDDGSTDETLEILSVLPPRVHLLRQERGGPSRARNLGLDHARGEFIAFLDSDDLWREEKLQLQLGILQQDRRLGGVCCDMVESEGPEERPESFFQRIGFTGGLDPEKMFFVNPIATPTLVARRSCLEEVGRFDPGLRGAEDYEYFYRLLRVAPVRPVFRVLVRRRYQPDRLSRDGLRMAQGTIATLERALEWFPDLRDRLGPAIGPRFSRLYLDLAYARLLEGDFRRARGSLIRSLRYSPTTWRAWLFLSASLLGRTAFHRLRGLQRSRNGGQEPEAFPSLKP